MSILLNEGKKFIKERADAFITNTLLKCFPALRERVQSRRYGVSYPVYFSDTKTLFIHIPKAAGSSFSMGLYGRQVLHIPATVWRDVSPEKFSGFFKFTVIRDPVDRFISAFDFLRRGGAGNHPADLKDSKELIADAELKRVGAASLDLDSADEN